MPSLYPQFIRPMYNIAYQFLGHIMTCFEIFDCKMRNKFPPSVFYYIDYRTFTSRLFNKIPNVSHFYVTWTSLYIYMRDSVDVLHGPSWSPDLFPQFGEKLTWASHITRIIATITTNVFNIWFILKQLITKDIKFK